MIKTYKFRLYPDKEQENILKQFELIRQLEYKSTWKNKKFYQINTFYPSSQICSCCDNKNVKVKDLKVRKWICDKCGMEHDRDINASVNIMIKGIERYVLEELI